MNILHLTLKKQWFEKILHGQKNQEYRALTHYWQARLMHPDGTMKQYDYVRFRNGYARNAPTMDVDFIVTQIGYPNREWCEKGSASRQCFIIQLGQIQNTKNIK